MLEQPDESPALGGDHAEFVLDSKFRDAVAIDVVSGHVDQTVQVLLQDMAFPRGVLVPRELLDTRRHSKHVGTPVAVQVGHQHCVAAGYFGLDHVRFEFDRGGGRNHAGEETAEENETDQFLTHAGIIPPERTEDG